jgi:GNAT superfamily N-acetyltransferase
VGEWTADAVLAAAAAWAWVPPDATQVLTDDYQLVCYPAHYNIAPVRVLWSRSSRPVSELISEISRHALAWGHSEVEWDISAATRPASTEAELLSRGASLTWTVQVLGYDMTAGLPVFPRPAGLRTEIVSDEPGLWASQLVASQVWGHGHEPTEVDIARELPRITEGLANWSIFRVVGFVGDEPACTGGCTLVDRVAQMWGGATRPALRGRGAYRAVLAHRMAVAREHGATLALVKGVAGTSAPILRRAGFIPYGEERSYRVSLTPVTSELAELSAVGGSVSLLSSRVTDREACP